MIQNSDPVPTPVPAGFDSWSDFYDRGAGSIKLVQAPDIARKPLVDSNALVNGNTSVKGKPQNLANDVATGQSFSSRTFSIGVDGRLIDGHGLPVAVPKPFSFPDSPDQVPTAAEFIREHNPNGGLNLLTGVVQLLNGVDQADGAFGQGFTASPGAFKLQANIAGEQSN